MNTDRALHYNDICLIPNYSELTSRKYADVSVNFLGRKFKLPIIPSNMKCVIDEKLAFWLSENNYFYIMHRFGIDNFKFIENANLFDWNLISISVGVNDDDKRLIDKLSRLRIDYITIDIAHGHSSLMRSMINHIKTTLPNVKIIAGNVATFDGYCSLVDWGADAIKAGIGGGSICGTKNKTGFTLPMYSCLKEIREYKNKPIIADGGIREHGDIVKAIHAGATMVMAGGIFSKLVDSPAEVIDGHKIYYGSASEYNKGEYKNVEGIKKVISLEGMTYADKLVEIEQDLQSAVSYSGGNKLIDIRNCDYRIVNKWEA